MKLEDMLTLLFITIMMIYIIYSSIYLIKIYNENRNENHETLSTQIEHSNLLNLINNYRTKNGLNYLLVDSNLCELALDRAKEVENDWSHDGFYGHRKGKYIRIGENLAKCFDTDEEIFNSWLKSDSHKKIITGEYDRICIARLDSDKCDYVVMEVAK